MNIEKTKTDTDSEKRRQARRKQLHAAMWSLHVHGQQLNTSFLPRALRPMRLDYALVVAVWGPEPDALTRGLIAWRQMLLASGQELPANLDKRYNSVFECDFSDNGEDQARVADLGQWASEGFSSDAWFAPTGLQNGQNMFNLFPQLEPLSNHFQFLRSSLESLQLNARFADLFLFVLVRLRKLGRQPGCTQARSPSMYFPFAESTYIDSSVIALRPFDHVAADLDPRNWPKWSILFEEMQPVEPDGPCDWKDREIEAKPGSDWEGYVYERAHAGVQGVENILEMRIERKADEIAIHYELHESLSYTHVGLKLGGLMRQNQGKVVARRLGDERTQIEVDKTVHFGRLTRWSASSFMADYGELLNYLAPAFLTLWVSEAERFLPCGCSRSAERKEVQK